MSPLLPPLPTPTQAPDGIRSTAARLYDTAGKMDSSQAPLMADDRQSDELHDESATADLDRTPSDASKTPESGPGAFVLMLTFAAGISGLLFGCVFFYEVPWLGAGG